jgi:hypothetical protein
LKNKKSQRDQTGILLKHINILNRQSGDLIDTSLQRATQAIMKNNDFSDLIGLIKHYPA